TEQVQLDDASSADHKTLQDAAHAKAQPTGLYTLSLHDALPIVGSLQESGAAAKNLADLQQQGAEASTTLAELQAKLKTAQSQLDHATSERQNTRHAAANDNSQLSGQEQQADAAAKSAQSQRDAA